MPELPGFDGCDRCPEPTYSACVCDGCYALLDRYTRALRAIIDHPPGSAHRIAFQALTVGSAVNMEQEGQG